MGCGSSKSTAIRDGHVNKPVENDGTVIQDLEADDKSGYLYHKKNGGPSGRIQPIPRNNVTPGDHDKESQQHGDLPPIKLRPIIQANELSSHTQHQLQADDSDSDLKRPVAFDLTLDGKYSDPNSNSIIKKHPPKRLQRLQPLPGVPLTAETLAEKIRDAEVRKEKELQRRARSAQQSDRRRQRLLRNKSKSDEPQSHDDLDQSSEFLPENSNNQNKGTTAAADEEIWGRNSAALAYDNHQAGGAKRAAGAISSSVQPAGDDFFD